MILQNGTAELTLPAEREGASSLSDWLESILAEIHFPLKSGQQILIAADEIFTNIADYAYPGTAGIMSVTAKYDSAVSSLALIFTDHGVPFNPLEQTLPDVSGPASERKIGGLGLLLVRRIMDSVSYQRENDCNILKLTKLGGNGQ